MFADGRRAFKERPTAIVQFKPHRAAFADHGDRCFVGGLVLIEGIIRHDIAVAREDVHGVLDVHAVNLQMCRISHHPVDRADEPLAGVEQVRQGVLHRPAAGGPMCIVGTAVGRPIKREVLPRDRDELERSAENGRMPARSHLRERRLRPHDIADGGHDRFRAARPTNSSTWSSPTLSGFSMSTCTLRSRSWIACGTCDWAGVAMTAASARCSIASSSVGWAVASRYRAAIVVRSSGFTSKNETRARAVARKHRR